MLGAVGLVVEPAAAQDAAPSADLAITIKASASRVKPHHPVFFYLTVTNRGPDSESGAVITLQLHNGLSRPKLVAAPPDTVVTSCSPSATPGTPPDCSSHWVPPVCQARARSLTCRYRDFQFAPPTQPGNSIPLTIKARTGMPAREMAVAAVRGTASDPRPANNRAARRLRIRAG